MLNYNTSNFRTDSRQETWLSVQKKTNVCFEEDIDEIQNGHHVRKNGKTESGNLNNVHHSQLL